MVAMRPMLLLDVDGVLSPIGASVPPGLVRRTTSSFDVVIREDHGRWLRALAEEFDLVWATTWGEAANRVHGQLLGLPSLPVLALGELPREGTRKLAAVKRHVGTRPIAWIDDELYDDAQAWAHSRRAPTLLVRTRPSIGLQHDEVDRLRESAHQLLAS